MPVRMAITKVSGQGEQLVMDVCQWNPVTGDIVHDSVDEMQELMDQCLEDADDRLHEMNMRMLHAYNFEQYFTPGVWQQVVAVLDVLAGRQSPAAVVARWDSIKEENAELEAGRLAAQAERDMQGQNGVHLVPSVE